MNDAIKRNLPIFFIILHSILKEWLMMVTNVKRLPLIIQREEKSKIVIAQCLECTLYNKTHKVP